MLFFFPEVHPEPEIAPRSRMHSFTAGFKKPFRKKNKDSPKFLPKNPHSPIAVRRAAETTTSSPLLKAKVEKQPDTTNGKNGTDEKQPDSVPRASPRPKRPPPPKPPLNLQQPAAGNVVPQSVPQQLPSLTTTAPSNPVNSGHIPSLMSLPLAPTKKFPHNSK